MVGRAVWSAVDETALASSLNIGLRAADETTFASSLNIGLQAAGETTFASSLNIGPIRCLIRNGETVQTFKGQIYHGLAEPNGRALDSALHVCTWRPALQSARRNCPPAIASKPSASPSALP
jgi:hypothetical protein